jgi:hypothetical protein
MPGGRNKLGTKCGPYIFASSFTRKDTGGEWGDLLPALAPPHPRGAINRAPTPVAIAALGLHQQCATSIRKDVDTISYNTLRILSYMVYLCRRLDWD